MFAILKPEAFRAVYVALIRPFHENGLIASPHYLGTGIDLIVRLLWLATRPIQGLRGLYYKERHGRINPFAIEGGCFGGILFLQTVRFKVVSTPNLLTYLLLVTTFTRRELSRHSWH